MEAYCKICEQSKSVEDFPKGATILYKCKSCVASHRRNFVWQSHRREISCDVCQKIVSYGNMNKHMFVHTGHPKDREIVGNCGKVLKEFSLRHHIKTKHHLAEIKLAE